MKKDKSKYFHIPHEKEVKDTHLLFGIIMKDRWFDKDTIIVNCSPDYSSILSQRLNHSLSFLNKNELFEQMSMEMPYPNSSQVWNNIEKCYEHFDVYLKKWIINNIYPNKFLFIDSATLRGKNFSKLRLSLRGKLDDQYFRFASLYLQDDSIFTPDYYVEKFNKQQQGGLLFEWENPLNPNWDY